MKKILLLVVVMISICSCEDWGWMEPKENSEKSESSDVLQTITGSSDCTSCSGWSWNNGVATCNYDISKTGVFSFEVKATGQLQFDYASESSNNLLTVTQSDQVLFAEKMYGSKHCNCGIVNQGSVISFKATVYYISNCEVSNICITK